ncbi:MAG: hypothetical protein IT373_12960 [Polyangiaceae bacterium]|nr:hypothetical protein [Polyangiaceae bacterium]
MVFPLALRPPLRGASRPPTPHVAAQAVFRLAGSEADCPGCFMPQDPNLFSDCEASHCVAADVRALELAACNAAADCTLRSGLACCEGCGLAPPEGLVAVKAGAAGMLSALVCAPDWGCPTASCSTRPAPWPPAAPAAARSCS